MAQDTGFAGNDDPAAEPSYQPPPVAQAYADGWQWQTTGPTISRTASFVALSSPGNDSDQALALDGAGGVWRSHDGANQWQRVLAAPRDSGAEGPSEEELLLDAEVLTGDLPDFEELFETDFEEFDGELDEAIRGLEAGRESIDALDLQDQLQSVNAGDSAWFDGALSHSPQEWVIVLAGRSDGIWRSVDAGRTFRSVKAHVQVSQFAWGGVNAVVGSTPSGLVVSYDRGETWSPCEGVGRDFAIFGVTHDLETGWWAVSEGGLLRSQDGKRWRFSGSSTGLVGVRLTAIGIQGESLWVSTETGILRSDDQGATFSKTSNQHLPGVRTIRPESTTGSLLIATADGVWHSQDGGYRWRPVSSGLRQPLMRDLAQVAGVHIVASEDGLHRLVRARPMAPESKTDPSRLRSPPLAPLVEAALHRPGVNPATAGLDPSRSAISRLMPELNLDLQVVDRYNLSVDFVDRSNAMDTDLDWRLMAHLSWGQGSNSDPGSSALANAEFSDLYYVLRGEVYSSDEEGSVLSAASRLTTGSSQYRVQLSEQVALLYYSRERLARRVELGPSGDLHQDVHRQLDLQELTARIDAYTEGALSRALQGS
ncbi:MAG: hypothetical protein VX519_09560 [Myxococcota bacterium]|nr:hypothetical protein [Myxococcota bacterium]